MPRTYKAKPGAKKRTTHDKNDIQMAIDAIKSGKTYRKAEKTFNIPRSVLARHMKTPNL